MQQYLILCKSLTAAQRSARTLMQRGFYATVQRTPLSLSENGCGTCVRLSSGQLSAAVKLLRSRGLSPGKCYAVEANGTFREVQP